MSKRIYLEYMKGRAKKGSLFEVKKGAKTFEELPRLSPNALKVLERRYLRKDASGRVIETPQDMFVRVATEVAKADKIYDPQADVDSLAGEFYRAMVRFEFLPNSPTLMNAGRELGQLSACFVLPIEDSLESIFTTLKNAALIHQSGGGTGFSFSRLRPKNDRVKTTAGVSSGPVSFMQVYDAATETIKQGGTRRGANIAILRVDHPDILEFINAKSTEGSLPNFNISVAITDDFMERVFSGQEYNLINPRDGSIACKLNAKEVFELIAKNAWATGEPGVIFLDRINRDNPTPELGEIESTNPCGEQPLLPYESCNLGSINLSKMFTGNKFDFAKLARTVALAVHFLDNVIDVNRFPLKEIEEITKANRKIGLGVMGFADALIKLGIPYDSVEAENFAGQVMSFIQSKAREASMELAKTRGTFPNYEKSIYAKMNPPLPLRNATLTTIAPTGTISIIAGCSSGIEPIFSLCYVREVLDGTKLFELHPLLVEKIKQENLNEPEILKLVMEKGNLGSSNVPENLKRLFVTAHEISPEWHIRIQAAFQRYTDNAVSKTINFRADAKLEDVREAFILAYKSGCKGITVYRDKCRELQVLNVGIKKEGRPQLVYRERPQVTTGMTFRLRVGCGNLYVTVNEDEFGICEVFARLGKTGGCASSYLEALSRLSSVALRSGVNIEVVIQQLKGIGCASPSWEGGRLISSCSDAIAKAIEMYLERRKEKGDEKIAEMGESRNTDLAGQYGRCPDCGSPLEFVEGCLVCRNCGHSKCK